jgi:protein-S-isoprenylcysteine O-methyltransferase Ste14
MKNSVHKKVILVFFLGLALLAALEMGLARIFAHTLYSGWWQTILSLLVTLVGAALVVWSVQTLYVLGKGTPAPMTATQRLVRAGPYRYSRNPMTLGAGLFYLGLAAWAGAWIVFVLVLLIFISLLTYIFIHETQELAERFGVEYLQYRKEVPFLIPRIPR